MLNLKIIPGFCALGLFVLLPGCEGIKEPVSDAAASLDRVLGTDDDGARTEAQYQKALIMKDAGDAAGAAEAFRSAAEAGHAAAAFELGLAYNCGCGVEKNSEEAARWINYAAEQDSPEALFLIGAAYSAGQGVETDERKAAELLGRAAVFGHPRAQYLLGDAFYKGQGVPQDRDWAARWYGKAAYQGHEKAQLAYAAMWIAGFGTPKDPVVAYNWLKQIADKDETAARMLGALKSRMTSAQIAEAERMPDPVRSPNPDALGDKPTIIYVQRALTRIGLDPGGVDGLIGPRTRQAIRAFEERAELPVNGTVTPALLEKLLAETRTLS